MHEKIEKDSLQLYLKQVQEQFEERPALVVIYDVIEQFGELEETLKSTGHIVRFKDSSPGQRLDQEDQADMVIHNVPDVSRIDGVFHECLTSWHEACVPVLLMLPDGEETLREKYLSMNVEAVIVGAWKPDDILCRVTNLLKLRRYQQWNDMLMRQLTDLLQRRTHDLIDEERQTVIDNLINGIFHNIRGPLTGMFFACDNMEMSVQALTQSIGGLTSQRELADIDMGVKMMRKALEKMNDMLCKLLERSEADSRAFPQVVDLNSLLTQEIELMKADMDFKHHIRRTEELHPEPIFVKVVRGEISQSIYSLIRNAIEAVDGMEGPHIAIRTDLKDGMANLYIEDNGKGITHEVGMKIFEPFFSTKSRQLTFDQGISVSKGLGLHFVLQSLRANQGLITVDTKPGRTCFRLRFPLYEEP